MESCFENHTKSSYNDANLVERQFQISESGREPLPLLLASSDLLTAKEISPNSTRLEQNTWMLEYPEHLDA